MKEPWYISDPGLFRSLQEEIEQKYPSLHVLLDQGRVKIRGALHLRDEKPDIVLDIYQIEIAFPQNYPKLLPIVKEIGGRIPQIADRHISHDGSACLFVPDEGWKFSSIDQKISDFLEGPIRHFFLAQTYYEITGKWPFEQRSHGAKGIIEYYKEELGTGDINIIRRFVEYLSKKEIKGHWSCYCTSGKRLRACHFDKLLEYRNKIKPSIAQRSLIFILMNELSQNK